MMSMLRTELAIALLLLLAVPAAAQTADPEKTAAEMINPAARKAIDQGLQWLAGRQNDDGSFGLGTQRGNAAICGLCGMAFMSGGSTPGRGPYGHRVELAVDYLLANAQPSGFIIEPTPTTHGPMYSHGFATLFLAECYGMSKRTDLRDKLGLAVKLIVNTQNKEGGWRYYPEQGRRRHLRDGLPGDGPAGRAQRRHSCSQGDHRAGGQVR